MHCTITTTAINPLRPAEKWHYFIIRHNIIYNVSGEGGGNDITNLRISDFQYVILNIEIILYRL